MGEADSTKRDGVSNAMDWFVESEGDDDQDDDRRAWDFGEWMGWILVFAGLGIYTLPRPKHCEPYEGEVREVVVSKMGGVVGCRIIA